MSVQGDPGRMDVSSSARNLMTGTATKYLLLAVNIGIGIVLMPFTIRHLGTTDYGLWMLVASMTAYFQLLDLGYGNGLVKHVAAADGRRDVGLANQILSTFFVVYAAIGLVCALGILAVIIWIVPRFPHLTPDQIGRARALVALLGLRMAVGFPMTVFGAATTARQRFAINNTVAVVVALVNAAVTYVLLASGRGVVTLVAATTAVGLGSYAAYAWTAKRVFPELRIRLSAFNPRLVRDVTAFSAYLFLIDIAVQIGFNFDNVVIGAALGTSAIAVYTIALRLADYQRQLCNQFNGLLFPLVVRFDAQGQQDALRRMLVDGTRVALTLVVGVTIWMTAFASPLIEAWMGPGFGGSVVPLYVLAATGIVLVGQGPLGSLLLGTGRHRLVALVSLGEALANLALSIVLVRRYGILGAAIGTAVPVFVANLFILLPAACRQVSLGVAEFARLTLGASFAGMVPALVASIVLRTWVPPHSLTQVLGEGAFVGVVYLIAACTLGLDTLVRARYADYVRRLVTSLAIGRARTAHI